MGNHGFPDHENAPGCGSGGVLRSRQPLPGAASRRIVALRPSHARPALAVGSGGGARASDLASVGAVWTGLYEPCPEKSSSLVK
jgi:hypothetical protein